MPTIEERAISNADLNNYTDKVRSASIGSYYLGATDQRRIDILKAVEILKQCNSDDIKDKNAFIGYFVNKMESETEFDGFL